MSGPNPLPAAMFNSDLSAWTDCPLPAAISHQGRYVTLEPLNPTLHTPALWQEFAARGPDMWTWLPFGPFADQAALQATYEEHVSRPDWVTFAIRPQGGHAAGIAAYMRINPANGSIEIGALQFGNTLMRSRAATEALYLLIRHVFDDLGYRRCEWKCDTRNEASYRAAQRLGFVYEGTFRQHMVVKGQNRDTAWFSILDSEWIAVKIRLERWLDPSNFDAQGYQKAKLLRCD